MRAKEPSPRMEWLGVHLASDIIERACNHRAYERHTQGVVRR